MVRMIGFALATTILAGCAAQPTPPVAAVVPAAPVAAEAPAMPKPEYGTFGFDSAGMDRSVAPGDDFFAFANGTSLRNTPMPPDKWRYGMFNTLDNLSREPTRTIIEEDAKDSNSRIRHDYAS